MGISFKSIIGGIACLTAPWIGGVIVFSVTDSLAYAIVALVCVSALAWAVLRYVFIDPRHAKYLAASSVVVTGFICASGIWLSQSPIIWQIADRVLRVLLPNVALPNIAASDWPTVVVIISILAVALGTAFLILRNARAEQGGLRKASEVGSKQLSTIRRTLQDHLDDLDQNLSFFDFRSAAIDPKLELLNSTSRNVSIKTAHELVSSACAGQFIVVKGEPGSGKSVLLRNLVRQLLANVEAGGKIPLLLNLKEWTVPENQSNEAALRSLAEWVRSEYGSRTGARPPDLANEEFDQLYAEGGFVLLFDSFDENELVSISPHNGIQIKGLSFALAEYVRGSGGCVGLVFSREFKAPLAGWIDHLVYGLRPFTDADIKKYLKENCIDPKSVSRAIFGQRYDLYAMAKTPLLLALIVDFCNQNGGKLPTNEFEIFESFVSKRIETALEHPELSELQPAAVQMAARELARRTRGAPENERANENIVVNATAVRSLRDARLLRDDNGAITFSHKRFQEYFRVLGMLQEEEDPPSLAPGHIDENRDVLNLYAQICSEDRAQGLVSQAHDNLKDAHNKLLKTGQQQFYEALILSLRFLKDAFRNRPRVVDPYRHSIRGIIVGLWNSFDILHQKHAVEHINLLPPMTAANLVRLSMEQNVRILRRVALWQARYVSALQPWLGRCVAAHFSKLNDVDYAFELRRSGVATLMSNAAPVDRISLMIDAAFRVALIAMLALVTFLDDPLLGAGFTTFLMLLYLALVIGNDGTEIYWGFEYGAETGFNAGLSGFIAFNIVFLLFWNALGAVLGSREIFWDSQGAVWVSIALILISGSLAANNFLARRRDALDDLGEINPLSRDTIAMERPTTERLAEFLRRNWIFVVFLGLFVWISTTGSLSWTMTILVAAWVFLVFGLAARGVIGRFRDKIVARLDRPKVIKFKRHFTGQRSEINAALAEVRTSIARIDLLIIADSKAEEFARILRDPANAWPEGKRPTYGIDVDGFLAVLDERWLGLA